MCVVGSAEKTCFTNAVTFTVATYVPFAVMSIFITRTVSTNDDWLLRTNSS